MQCWGLQDVRLTGCGPDGGIDVESDEAVAQVKALMVPVGSPEIQQLKGAAYDGRKPLFFSLMNYTTAAKAFADRAEVALFRFTAYDGAVEPVNEHARQLLASFEDECLKQEQRLKQGRRSQQSIYFAPIFKLVTTSISKMLTEPKGVGLFTVKKNGNCVQFHWAKDKEIKLVIPKAEWLTREDTIPTILDELGWHQNFNSSGIPPYFFCYFHQPFPIKHIERLMTVTLIDVNGASSPFDIEVTIESP